MGEIKTAAEIAREKLAQIGEELSRFVQAIEEGKA